MKYRVKMLIGLVVSCIAWVGLPHVLPTDAAFPLMLVAMLVCGVFLARVVLGDPEAP